MWWEFEANLVWFIEKRNDLGLQKWKLVAEIQDVEAIKRGKEIATNILTVIFQENIPWKSSLCFIGFILWWVMDGVLCWYFSFGGRNSWTKRQMEIKLPAWEPVSCQPCDFQIVKDWQEERASYLWESHLQHLSRGRATSQQHSFWPQQVCWPQPRPQPHKLQHLTQLITAFSRICPPQPIPSLLPHNSLPLLHPLLLLLSRLICRSLPTQHWRPRAQALALFSVILHAHLISVFFLFHGAWHFPTYPKIHALGVFTLRCSLHLIPWTFNKAKISNSLVPWHIQHLEQQLARSTVLNE